MQTFKTRSLNSIYIVGLGLSTSIFLVIFFWIIGDIFKHSLPSFSLDFLWTAPREAGRSGGIRPIIISTIYILSIALLISLPVALLSGLFFSEKLVPLPKAFGPFKVTVDVLAGVPSVVFGLFGNTYFCNYLGLGYSIIAGALTLACMILPLAIKVIESSFRSIPDNYMKGAGALGLSYWTTFRSIMIPAIAPQIAGAFILSLGRALAETAALLFTSGYVLRDPDSILDSGRTLSIHIYDLSMNVTGGDTSAYKTAFVLVLLISIINLAAHLFIQKWTKKAYG